MTCLKQAFAALWRPVLLIMGLVFFGSGVAEADTTLAAVKATLSCADLAKSDLTGLEGAPARIDAATEVGAEAGKAAYCKVTGYIASNVRFEVRLPLDGWT